MKSITSQITESLLDKDFDYNIPTEPIDMPEFPCDNAPGVIKNLTRDVQEVNDAVKGSTMVVKMIQAQEICKDICDEANKLGQKGWVPNEIQDVASRDYSGLGVNEKRYYLLAALADWLTQAHKIKGFEELFNTGAPYYDIRANKMLVVSWEFYEDNPFDTTIGKKLENIKVKDAKVTAKSHDTGDSIMFNIKIEL